MIWLYCLSLFAAVGPSAPSATPNLTLSIDSNSLELTNLKIQSATTTSGRPTFVVMGDVGDETIFVRATLPKAEAGSYTVRALRLREESGPRASLNIDCRKDRGLPVLRPDGGTLVVTKIAVSSDESITQLQASFEGEMAETSGARHTVVMTVSWGD